MQILTLFCMRAFCEIQKPCGYLINNRTELYWMLNFHFHTSYGKICFRSVIVAVMTEDISWMRAETKEKYLSPSEKLWHKPALNHKETTNCSRPRELFLNRVVSCFEKAHNAILTRDKLSRGKRSQLGDLWWFLYHLNNRLWLRERFVSQMWLTLFGSRKLLMKKFIRCDSTHESLLITRKAVWI